MRDLSSKRIQVDEIWSFTYAKHKNVASAKRQDLAYGDTWTWTAIDADTKLIISYLVGGRDSDYAIGFMDKLYGPAPEGPQRRYSPAECTGAKRCGLR